MVQSVRLQVVNALLAIQQGQSLSQLLDPLLNKIEQQKPEDKGFAHVLLLTTLRHWYAQSRLINSLADKPIDEIEVRTVLHIGLTQLLYMNVADHAAIHETVEVIKQLGLARASGLINAILRKVSKNPNKYRKKCDKNHSLPNWLAKQLKQDWSEYYDELTQNLRQSAPIFLRVDHGSSEEYVSLLADKDIQATALSLTTAMMSENTKNNDKKCTAQFAVSPIVLVDSVPITALLNFQKGAVSVQDAHAQLAAAIIYHAMMTWIDNSQPANTDQPKSLPHVNLLDACAAPGGKLVHWLNLLTNTSEPNYSSEHDKKFHVKQSDANQTKPLSFHMTAIDNEVTRLERMAENLKRSHQNHEALSILCADATTWQADNAEPFDAILLDAPCTATGVIRRHPDISLLRSEADVKQTVALQASILDNLWQQLKPNGLLLYVTCSILKAENEGQMQAFIERHTDAKVWQFDDDICNWGIQHHHNQQIGRQCLPLNESGDGFYFALLQKQS